VGSPTAFVTKQIQIIDDVDLIPNPEKRVRGSYKSILSLPVNTGGQAGQCLAVINIDSEKKKYFKHPLIQTSVYPKLAPSITLLGLVLLLLEPGASYEFGN
jgi:hypothetical protein